MAKVDRLGWAAGIAFRSHGARIGVRVSDPDVLGRVAQHLPPGARLVRAPVVDSLYSLLVGGSSRPGVKRFNLVYAGSGQLARTMDLDEAFLALESSLHF